jgi:hypothetical protein
LIILQIIAVIIVLEVIVLAIAFIRAKWIERAKQGIVKISHHQLNTTDYTLHSVPHRDEVESLADMGTVTKPSANRDIFKSIN